MSGTQVFCLAIVVVIVVGGVLVAWAKAFAARKTGKWPEDPP